MIKIAFIGEAYGEEEERFGKPFIGKAGEQLNALLADAGLERNSAFITNVFNLRPPQNDLANLCGALRDPDVRRGVPSLSKGKYLREEYFPEVDRVLDEIRHARPNVTVLLGNTACWAVLGTQAISKIRGTICTSPRLPGLKFLPTYHPANILRQFENRHVTVLDLMKAKREMEFPELRRPLREIWMDPTLEDLDLFFEKFLVGAEETAVDVETAAQQVTCISFAPSIDRALVIPFLDYRFPGGHYWRTLEDEVRAWDWVAKTLALPSSKVGQNFQYDMQYIWKKHGIALNMERWDDTMLLHHSLLPESPKSLGFLGSVYTNEIAWKPNRPKSKHNEKPGDEE